jgi:hypothetical protein
MSRHEKHTEDLLNHYIDPEMIEKAPEGFTSNVMLHIQTEYSPAKTTVRLRNRNYIPVISGIITVLLIVLAYLISGKDDSLAFPATEFLKNIKFSLPDLNLMVLSGFNMPQTLIYGLFGILMLSILDIALNGVFNRQK